MGVLTRSEVKAIAELARLELDDDEVDRLRAELTAILAHMETLASVATDGVPAMTHALPLELRMRADVAGAALPHALALGGTSAHSDGCFRVPRIIATDDESGE